MSHDIPEYINIHHELVHNHLSEIRTPLQETLRYIDFTEFEELCSKPNGGLFLTTISPMHVLPFF